MARRFHRDQVIANLKAAGVRPDLHAFVLKYLRIRDPDEERAEITQRLASHGVHPKRIAWVLERLGLGKTPSPQRADDILAPGSAGPSPVPLRFQQGGVMPSASADSTDGGSSSQVWGGQPWDASDDTTGNPSSVESQGTAPPPSGLVAWGNAATKTPLLTPTPPAEPPAESPPLWPDLVDKVKKVEGFEPSLYWDEEKIAIGHGFNFKNNPESRAEYLALPLYKPGTSTPATQQEKLAEWNAMYPSDKSKRAAKGNLVLSKEDADTKERAKLTGFYKDLATLAEDAKLPSVKSLPPAAQKALLEMTYHMGPEAVTRTYPRMWDAIRKGDWERAAAESATKPLPDKPDQYKERNDWRAALFRSLIKPRLPAPTPLQTWPLAAVLLALLATVPIARAADALPVRWSPALIPSYIPIVPKTQADLKRALQTPWQEGAKPYRIVERVRYPDSSPTDKSYPKTCAELFALPAVFNIKTEHTDPIPEWNRVEGNCKAIAMAAQAVPARRSFLPSGPRELLDDLGKMPIRSGRDYIDATFELLTHLGVRTQCDEDVCETTRPAEIRCAETACVVTQVSQPRARQANGKAYPPLTQVMTVTSLALGDIDGDGVEDLLLSQIDYPPRVGPWDDPSRAGERPDFESFNYFVVTRTVAGGPLRVLEHW